MGAVTYFVRMVSKEGKAEEVQQLRLENPRRIEQGERGNLAFGVRRSIDWTLGYSIEAPATASVPPRES